MRKQMRKHHYAPAEWHILTVAIIVATIILVSLISPWEQDMTGIIVFPALFCGVITRCVYDWLFIIKTVIFTTVKYGCEHILKRTVKYIG